MHIIRLCKRWKRSKIENKASINRAVINSLLELSICAGSCMTVVVVRAFPARVEIVIDIRTIRWNNPCSTTTMVGSARMQLVGLEPRWVRPDICTLRWNNPCLATTKVGSAHYNSLVQDRRVWPIYHSLFIRVNWSYSKRNFLTLIKTLYI